MFNNYCFFNKNIVYKCLVFCRVHFWRVMTPLPSEKKMSLKDLSGIYWLKSHHAVIATAPICRVLLIVNRFFKIIENFYQAISFIFSQFADLTVFYGSWSKLPNLTKNGILNNFDFHGWPSESDIFWVMTVANSRICTISSSYIEIREFATAIAQNISDLEGQPWISKMLRMPFF